MVEIEVNGTSETNGHVDVEHQENGEKSPPMAIPMATQKEIIMTDYIKQSLDKVAASEGFENYTVDVDHGSSIGDGFMGIMLKVIIKEVDCDKELRVLAKIPPQNEARRAMMGAIKVFEREVFVYNVMLPEFVAVQKEKKIPDSMGFFNFPKVYYADFDHDLQDCIIVMEDLRETGHQMWSKYQPINFEHARLLLIALGRLHALSFAMKAKKPDLFEKYKDMSDFFMDSFSDPNFQGFLNQALQGTVNTLESEPKCQAKLIKMNESLMEILASCMDVTATEPFAVVNHGDCWTNNYLFHYTKRGKPDSITLIDWQISRYCSPIIDLVYFFFICTDQAFRKKHFDELLSIYHHSLKELLDHLGGDTMSQFPFTALLRHLKKFGKYGVAMAAMIVPMLQTKKEDLMDMEFMAEQMRDLPKDELEKMMKEYMEKNSSPQVAVDRMREVVQDAVKYGYL